MKRSIIYLLVVLVSLAIALPSTPALAKEKANAYILFPTTGTKGYREIRETFIMLLQGELERRGQTATRTKRKCEKAACAVLKAYEEESEANRAVLSRLIRVGRKFKMQLRLVDLEKELIIFTTMSGKFIPEDLDSVASRGATAIIKQKPFAKTVERGDVITEEEQGNRERRVEIKYGFALGAAHGLGGATKSQTRIVLDGGTLFMIDPWAFVSMAGFHFDTTGSSNTSESTIDIGLRRYFGKKDIAPYLTALIGTHYQNTSGFAGRWGFAASTGGGVSFFRTTSIEVPVEVKYQYVLFSGIPDSHSVTGTLGVFF